MEGHIRSGRRAGGKIIAVDSADLIDAFYDLYRATERRHGRKRPRHPRRFFRALH